MERPPKTIDELKLSQFKFPIKILKMERNSLNNRFLPFEAIRTEAVFIFDDDTRHLNASFIKGAFRYFRCLLI